MPVCLQITEGHQEEMFLRRNVREIVFDDGGVKGIKVKNTKTS